MNVNPTPSKSIPPASLRGILHALALALAVAILGIGFLAPSASAITIYSDTLTGSGSALNGTTVDSSVTYAGGTNGVTWTAAGSYNQTTTGTIGTDASKQGAYLPFTPQAGYVYTLTATLEYLGAGGTDWAALGFQTQADLSNSQFHAAAGNAYAWVLLRKAGGGQPQFFRGPDTTSGGAFATGSQSGLQTVSITLDTRAASWTSSATIGGYTSTTYTYSPNPTDIRYVGFGGVGTISKTTNFSLSAVSANPPVITATGSPLSALTTTYGTASAPANFTVSGAYMVAGILVTAPTGFEVSQSSGSGYAATTTVAGFGTIGNTTVYVRLAATAPIATYNSQNIVLTSSGATPVNVTTASSGNSVTMAATKLAITSTAVSTIAGVASGTITVQRQDADSSPVTAGPSITVTLSSDSAGTVTFSPSSLTIAYGASSATFTYTDTKAETPTITAASSSLTSATQVETVTPASATKLAFGVQPSTTGEGLAITPPVTVLVQDEYGNTVTGDGSSVTIASGTTAFTGSTLSTNTSNGVATFGNLKPTTVGSANTLTASDGSLTGAMSSEFVVLAGLPDHFAISTISSPQTAGTAITGITLTAQNADNSTMTTFTGTVGYGGTAGVTGTSGNFVNGVLSGVSVTPTAAGSGKTFTVTVGTVTSTSTFDVNPGALDHFTISAITPQTAGRAITEITLTALDAHNNTLSTGPNAFTGTVAFSGTAGITGTSASFTAGELSGVSVTPTVAGSGKTFIVTDAVSGKIGSSTFDVSPGALDHFAIAGIASPEMAGTAISNITLTAQDANHNTLPSFTGTVAYSGTALITGTSSAFVSGVLANVSVTPTLAGSGLDFMVTDSISGKTGTFTFDVNPGALDHFTISSIASPQTAGTAITGITLTARDANANTLSAGPNIFTGTVAYSGTAGITGTSDSFAAGVLSGVSVTPTVAGSGKTFIVTSSAKTGTATFDVNPAAVSAASSTVVASPSAVVANGTSLSTITVTVRDAYNNGIAGNTVTLASNRGSNDTISAASGTSSAAGVVTFTVKSTKLGSSVFSATDVTDSNLAITQTATVDWVVNLSTATGVFVYNTVAGGNGTLASSTGWPALGAIGSTSGNPWHDLTDGSTSTSWIQNWGVIDGANSGFYMTLPAAVVMQGIRFSTADISGRSPKTMTIEGSFATGTDLLVGANWTLIYSGTTGMDTALSYSPGNKVSFANNAAYTSYRVLFPTTIGHREVQVSDIVAYGTESVVSNPYDTWKTGPFAHAFTDTDPTHDPLGDGMTNFQKFAFGLDPTSGASINPVTPLIGTQFTYTRYATSGLSYTVEYSTDLAEWAPATTLETIGTPDPISGVQTVTVTVSDTPVNGKLFVRVRAE